MTSFRWLVSRDLQAGREQAAGVCRKRIFISGTASAKTSETECAQNG